MYGTGIRRAVRAVTLCGSMALAGCAGGVAFDERAVDYGRSLADASNRQILLNILRSAAREPLFFTLVSNVDSRSLGDIDVDIETPIGAASTVADLIAGVGLEDPTPRFSVSSLMKANFTRSMSRPVDLGVFERMLARDFVDELVMRLFIGKIGWQSEPLLNAPETFGKSDFRRRLRLLMALGLSTEPLLGDNTLIEDLEQEDMLQLMEELGVATPRMSIVPDRVTGKFDVIGEPGGFRLCFNRPPVYSLDDLSEDQMARAVDLTCRLWVVSQLTRADLGGRDLKRLTKEEKADLLEAVEGQIDRNADHLDVIDAAEKTEGDGESLEDLVASLLSQSDTGDEDGVGEQELGRLEHFGGLGLTIRSPVEIFDYLGALTRMDVAAGDAAPQRTVLPNAYYDPRTGCAGTEKSADATCRPVTFFRLREASPGARNAVFYEGGRYGIVNAFQDPDDRSIDTVAILADLIALFIDSDDVDEAARVTILP